MHMYCCTVPGTLLCVILTDRFHLLAMHVEWAKMKAHVDHWEEGILLTIKEMWHIIHFLDWHAKWWQERADLWPDVDPALHNGLCAYAAKQADMQQGLAWSFAKTWYLSLITNHFPIEWPSRYIPASWFVFYTHTVYSIIEYPREYPRVSVWAVHDFFTY